MSFCKDSKRWIEDNYIWCTDIFGGETRVRPVVIHKSKKKSSLNKSHPKKRLSKKRKSHTKKRSSKARSIKKSVPFKNYRMSRPSPNISATLFPKGTKRMGGDGNMWQVIIASNGVRRWKKIN